LKVVRSFDHMSAEIEILQRQVSALQQMVVNAPTRSRER
jgi:hypothetical protein